MNEDDDLLEKLLYIWWATFVLCCITLTIMHFSFQMYDGLSFTEVWNDMTGLAWLIGATVAGFVSMPVALILWFIDAIKSEF